MSIRSHHFGGEAVRDSWRESAATLGMRVIFGVVDHVAASDYQYAPFVQRGGALPQVLNELNQALVA